MDLLTWARAQWDRCAAWVLIVLGVVFLILGWVGVTRYAYPADQLPYIISGGIGGLMAVGVGAMLWLSADLRDEWRMLRRIEIALRDQSAVALVVDEPLRGPEAPFPARPPERAGVDLPVDERDPTREVEVYATAAAGGGAAKQRAAQRANPTAAKRSMAAGDSTGAAPKRSAKPGARAPKPLAGQ